MKAAADPLKVEYSFREYQKLIDRITQEHRGHVHNTMGDGAVSAFNTCADAFTAARQLQTEIASFNMNVNRLETPFRLRIGLHQGVIAGELDKIEFTEVIDIAAHVQGAAPIGGIAATETVMPSLSEHQFAQLQGTIDGCRVFIAMNPTLDA
jgi:class 3 adenylate cyclase